MRSSRVLRQSALWLGAAVSVGLLTGCGLRLVSPQEVRSNPDSHLFYPGSTLLDTQADGDGPPSGNDATVANHLSTSASQDAVLAWYRAQLKARGYDVFPDPAPNNYMWQMAASDCTYQFGLGFYSDGSYQANLSLGCSF